MQINEIHVQGWMRDGFATVVAEDIAAQFGLYLEGLPWLIGGGGLDWTRLRGKAVNLASLGALELESWLATVRLGRGSFIVFWYGPSEPAIACEKGFAVANFCEAFWKAPGKRYVFGADIKGGELFANFDQFAEYDGGETLIAVL